MWAFLWKGGTSLDNSEGSFQTQQTSLGAKAAVCTSSLLFSLNFSGCSGSVPFSTRDSHASNQIETHLDLDFFQACRRRGRSAKWFREQNYRRRRTHETNKCSLLGLIHPVQCLTKQGRWENLAPLGSKINISEFFILWKVFVGSEKFASLLTVLLHKRTLSQHHFSFKQLPFYLR